MQVIMENWRRYGHTEDNSGTLYLFEGRKVRETSFSKALNSIGDSEKELDLFFEQWERSLDYELKRLNEVDWKSLKTNPILFLSTQIFRLWNKAKRNILKYGTTLIRGSKKLNDLGSKFKTKSPALYKFTSFVSKTIVAFVALYVVQMIIGSSDAMAGDLTQFGDVVADADQLGNVADALTTAGAGPRVDYIADMLGVIADSPSDVDLSEIGGKTRDLAKAAATENIEKLTSMSNDPDLHQSYQEAAGQLADILGKPENVQTPEASAASSTFATGGGVNSGEILDQFAMLVKSGKELPADHLGLLKKMAQDASLDPELAEKAKNILKQIN